MYGGFWDNYVIRSVSADLRIVEVEVLYADFRLGLFRRFFLQSVSEWSISLYQVYGFFDLKEFVEKFGEGCMFLFCCLAGKLLLL